MFVFSFDLRINVVLYERWISFNTRELYRTYIDGQGHRQGYHVVLEARRLFIKVRVS